jgi:hypothetical protein
VVSPPRSNLCQIPILSIKKEKEKEKEKKKNLLTILMADPLPNAPPGPLKLHCGICFLPPF